LANQNSGTKSNDDAGKDLPSAIPGVTIALETNELSGVTTAVKYSPVSGAPWKEDPAEHRAKGDYKQRGNNRSLMQSEHEIFLCGTVLCPNREIANNGSKNTSSCNPQWKHDKGNISFGKSDSSDDRSDKRFEQVSTHASDISNIVSDIISNDSGVPRIIFRDIHLNLEEGTY
jgi:hypothetical protein